MKTNNERKSLKYHLDLKYPVSIETCPDGGYFAEIVELPGCFAEGRTVTEAHKMIDVARKLWIESAYEDCNDIPLPKNESGYSGKFIVRVPKSLHARLDKLAVREGVSLNQYLVSTLSRAAGLEEAGKRSRKK
jgi:antitoxin HicB